MRAQPSPRRASLYAAAVLSLAALASVAPSLAQQSPPPAAETAQPPATEEKPGAVTLTQLAEMYKSGTPLDALLNVVKTHEGSFDVTLDDMIRLRRQGLPPELLRAIALKSSPGAAGAASPEERLKQMQEQIDRETAAAEAQLKAMDAELKEQGVEIPEEDQPLAEKHVVKMAKQGTPGPDAVAAEVLDKGLKKLPEINDLLNYRAEGVPAKVVRAMGAAGLDGGKVPALGPASAGATPRATAPPPATAAAAPPAVPAAAAPHVPAPAGAAAPLATAELVKMIQSGTETEAISTSVQARGLSAPLTPADVTTLRQAGASDQTILAINQAQGIHAQTARAASLAAVAAAAPAATPAAQKPAVPPPAKTSAAAPAAGVAVPQEEKEEPEEPDEDEEAPAAKPAAAASAKRPHDVPSPQTDDRVWIASVPRGAQVYVAPAGIRRAEWSEKDYRVGVTPLSLKLAPGDYIVVVQKPRDAFDAALLPAWRTKHDTDATRSVLDNADLMINATHCCLPESFSGDVQVRPVFKDRPEILIGDMFEGLPPYLLDGETYQILRVRKAGVESVMKAYTLRKSPGGSRMIVASFVPTLAEPLDPNGMTGLPDGTPYAEMLHAETLDYLSDPKQLVDVASTLRVEPARLTSAVAMLGRAGKAIIPQKIDGGLRTLTLALDDYGRLRVIDQPTHPEDPFAQEVAPAAAKKKPKKVVVPPAPPALPVMTRSVVPGLGMPRLILDNKSARGQALIFSDGQFYYVPGKTRREFVIEPGSFRVRLIAPEGAQPGPPAEGEMHFAFQARYTVSL